MQVVAASELALSVLPHAAALNPNEIQRAIQQCKEQSHTVLEKACLAVEKAATGGGVYPEVMFEVARHWYHLFEKHAPSAAGEAGEDEAGLQHDHVRMIKTSLSYLLRILHRGNVFASAYRRQIQAFCSSKMYLASPENRWVRPKIGFQR